MSSVIKAYSLEDYSHIFDLTDQELKLSILDFAAGFSSFNATMQKKGRRVVSIDPNFDQPANELEKIFQGEVEAFEADCLNHPDQFVWDYYKSPQTLIDQANNNAKVFLNDLPKGLSDGRYLGESLPNLDFEDYQFQLCLCSQYLFKIEPEDIDFHVNAIQTLCRIAGEVRIHPLLTPEGEPSPLIGPVVLALQAADLGVEIREVNYELEKGGNAMLRVWAQACTV